MTTLAGRTNTALVVIDVQNGVVDGAHDRDGVVARIGSIVERARDAGAVVNADGLEFRPNLAES